MHQSPLLGTRCSLFGRWRHDLSMRAEAKLGTTGRLHTVGWETPARGTELRKDSLPTATAPATGIRSPQPATVRRRATTGTAGTVRLTLLHQVIRPIAGRRPQAIHPVVDTAAAEVAERSMRPVEAVGAALTIEVKWPPQGVQVSRSSRSLQFH